MIERHPCQEQREPEPAPAGQLQTLQQAQGQVGIGFAPFIKYRKAHQLALIDVYKRQVVATVQMKRDKLVDKGRIREGAIPGEPDNLTGPKGLGREM